MKIAGIICEYNPFHAMHAHHIAQTREKTGADYVICAMSGPFVQRGDLAICDKWTRAKMALLGGADAVFELPALFALRAAPDFALGGVTLLNALGAQVLSFGSECADLNLLKQAAQMQIDPKEGLTAGQSYPRAIGQASGKLAPFMEEPNFTLGVEYLRAMNRHAPDMQACVIPRIGSHHGAELSAHASASAIRAAIFEGGDKREMALDILPKDSAKLLRTCQPVRLEALEQAIFYALYAPSPQALSGIHGMREGLENRIFEAAQHAGNLKDLLDAIKCKRYTMAAIRRAVCACLLGMTKELADRTPMPPYARVLGLKKSAAPLLRQAKLLDRIPIITKAADAPENECLKLDFHAQDLWDLAAEKVPRSDLTTSPIILD